MRFIAKFRNLLFPIMFPLLLSPAAGGQVLTEIAGRILDQNNAAVAGASVVVRDASDGAARSAISDAGGGFRIAVAGPGPYRVTVSAEGFEAESVEIKENRGIAEIHLRPAKIAAVVSITSSYLAGSAEALEQTAGSIQTIDRFQLENSRVFEFSEVLRKISGVTARDEEGFGLRPNIGIRGTNPTRSAKVLLLEDGVPLAYAPYGDNASYYHPPVERFESIEVQKGSGQIAYGPVTVAGLVNYITPNPPAKTSLSLRLIGGNRDLISGNALFGGTFGRTGLIVNLNRKQGAGARENVRSGLTDVSSKFVQTVNSRNVITAKFSVFAENSRVTYSGLTESEYRANPRANPFGNDSFIGRRIGFSLQHVAVFGPQASLSTTIYANRFSRDWWRQSSNSAQRPNRLTVDPDCRSMADLNTTCGNEGRLRDYVNWAIEPKLSVRFDLGSVRNEFNGGFRFTRENQERVQRNGERPTSRDGLIVESNIRRNQALSGFVQNRFVFKDFAVSAGVRVERIEFERQNRLSTAAGRTSVTEIIPGIGLTYNLFKNTTLFAGVHRGFAPPRTEDIISNSGGIVEIDAEKSWNYEAGVRTRPLRGFSLESTFFRTDYRNQIVPASVAGGVGAVFTNGGRTLHQGIEVSGRFDSADRFGTGHNFYFQAGYTFLDKARFAGRRFSSVSGFSGVSVSGNRLPYAPRTTLNAILGLAYRDFDGFLENNFIDRQFADDLNTVDPIPNGQRGAIQRQTYWNATVNYRIEKLRSVVFLTVKNIFDRIYVVDRSRGILPSGTRLVQAGFKIGF